MLTETASKDINKLIVKVDKVKTKVVMLEGYEFISFYLLSSATLVK